MDGILPGKSPFAGVCTMIEVVCSLDNGVVFLTGQTIQCTVTLHCRQPDPPDPADQSAVLENIAWVSAQVQCFCQVNEQVTAVHDESSARATSGAGTAYRPDGGGERGRIVLATKPTILVCDLQLQPGQSHRLSYSQTLPAHSPASYRGNAVCYIYKITIGTQRVNGSIRLLRAPIRVLCVDERILLNGNGQSDEEDICPSNPFLPSTELPQPPSTLQLLQMQASKRSLNSFNITNQHGRVVRFCIYKLAYRLGEEVVARLDFSGAQVPCVQYSVRLESVETVTEQHRRRVNQPPHIQQYTKCHEVCLNMSECSMSLPIPLHVTPSFTTDLVSLQWRLHFEFVTRSEPPPPPAAAPPPSIDGHVSWEAPEHVHIETMVWDLPIAVHPSSPNHVAQVIRLSDVHTAVI